jgi:hypothetical protein
MLPSEHKSFSADGRRLSASHYWMMIRRLKAGENSGTVKELAETGNSADRWSSFRGAQEQGISLPLRRRRQSDSSLRSEMTSINFFRQRLRLPIRARALRRYLLPLRAASRSASKIGTEKWNCEPCPISLSTQMRPPWPSTRCLAIERPSPVPPTSRERATSAR